jgi:hypothetical protein
MRQAGIDGVASCAATSVAEPEGEEWNGFRLRFRFE